MRLLKEDREKLENIISQIYGEAFIDYNDDSRDNHLGWDGDVFDVRNPASSEDLEAYEKGEYDTVEHTPRVLIAKINSLLELYPKVDDDSKEMVINNIKSTYKTLIINIKKTDDISLYKRILSSLKKDIVDTISVMDSSGQSDMEPLNKSKLKPDFSDRVAGSDSRGVGRFPIKYDRERSRFS